MKQTFLILALFATVVACGTKKTAGGVVDTMPNQSDIDRVQGKFPGYTLNELNEGRKLYQSNCALCHDLKKPTSESEEAWRKIVPPMVQKANKKNGNALDATGEEKILRYVVTMSLAGKE